MESEQREYRWVRLALLSAAIRVGLALAPAVLVAWFSLLLLHYLSRGHAPADAAVWLGVTAVFAAGVVLAMELLTARLRTLADLFDVSMVFPYRPPSRASVALGSPYHLELGLELDGVRRALRHSRRGGAAAADAAPHLDRVESILTLAAVTASLERGTRRHSHDVARLADRIAVVMGLDRRRRRWLRWAALLHDVGKLVVPDEILHKPHALTAEERDIIRRHVQDGARIVEPLMPLLGPWSRAVAEHHERWDGCGYPLGLRGDEISLAGRIVAVADCYATMTRGRVYQGRARPAAALAEIAGQAGRQFDPTVVEAFERSWRVRRSPLFALRLPRIVAGTVASAWASLGVPAGSSAAALGILGAVSLAAATAPGVNHALRSLPRPPLAPIKSILGVPPPDITEASPTPSPRSVAPAARPIPTPSAAAAVAAVVASPGLPPALEVPATAQGVEGVTLPISGSVSANGDGVTVTVDFGDGSPIQGVFVSGRQFQMSHTYTDEGAYRFVVSAKGEHGTSTVAGTATVTDYSASVVMPSQATAGGGALSVHGEVADPSSDPILASVDYGDGTGPQALTLDGRSFNLQHAYPTTGGTYTLTVSIRDDDGVGPSATMTVTVPAPSPSSSPAPGPA